MGGRGWEVNRRRFAVFCAAMLVGLLLAVVIAARLDDPRRQPRPRKLRCFHATVDVHWIHEQTVYDGMDERREQPISAGEARHRVFRRTLCCVDAPLPERHDRLMVGPRLDPETGRHPLHGQTLEWLTPEDTDADG